MNPAPFDTLSAAVRQWLDAARGGGAYEQLVVRTQQTQQPPTPHALGQSSPDDLFDAKVTRPDEARCVLAGLWLFADELDRAHRIVQDVASSSGSFWHAIVHRREGDFSNSRYWYARCAGHPVLRGARPGILAGPALVDLVEDVVNRPADDARRGQAVRAQRLEWEALLDHCARAATATGATTTGSAAGGGA